MRLAATPIATDMGPPRIPRDLEEILAAGREDLRRRSRAERVRPISLWIGILTGPIAFLIVRTLSIILLSHACASTGSQILGLPSAQVAIAVVTLLGALATLGAGLLSWRIWRRTSLPEDEVTSGAMPRVAFWALGGGLLSAFFLVAIVFTGGLAVVLPGACP